MIRLSVAVALLVCVAPRVGGTAKGSERLVVATEEGRISGFKEQSTKGRDFYSFHSIPFAKPPVGNLRLKDPVAAEGWQDVKDGSVVPPLCLQIPFIKLVKRQALYDGDEDCLYLSVFTSKPGDPEAKLPVMVFIHGGGFFSGGINKYTPYVLLNEDIVLVLIQYRVGVLGFLSTEDSVIPGNFGLKDQTMALHWIQKNIHHFGGDPRRVTLFGESAGAASVHFHILSPYSKGLFKRGIMQSGTLFCPWAMGGSFKEVAEYTRELFACPAPQGKFGGPDSDDLLRCLQTVNAENLTLSLIDHILFNFNPVSLGPRVDGDYLPSEPEVLMVQGDHNYVDVISGINSHEGGLFAIPIYAIERMQSDLVNNFPEIGPASLDIGQDEPMAEELARWIFNHYVGGVTVAEEDSDNICEMYGDRHFNMAHDMTAILYAKNVSPHRKTFLYELNHRGQWSFSEFFDSEVGQHWVSHVDELFYLFTGENTLWKPLEREEDLRLRDIITKLWANFAATGNPTPDDSLGFIWESTSSGLEHLSLTPTPTMDHDKRKEVREFWELLPTKQNLLLHPSKIVSLEDDGDHKSGDNLKQKKNSQAHVLREEL